MPEPFDYRTIRGILPTVLTPYDDRERIDPDALEAEVMYLVAEGVHGLVLMGSIGESPYLSDADRETIIHTSVEVVGGKAPIIVGITAESTFVAAEQVRQAARLGAQAVMICLPQYFEVKFDDVKKHYERLAAESPLPIFYYHYPAASRLDLAPAQIAELLSIPNIVGIKESTFDMAAVKRHIELTKSLERIYLSGSELNFIPFMDLGGHGAVSTGSVIMPRTAVAMYDAYVVGDRAKATELQSQLFEVLPVLKDTTASVALTRPAFLMALKQGLNVPIGIEAAQVRIKAALAARGVPIKPIARSPLRRLTPRDETAVEAAMRKIEAIEPTPGKRPEPQRPARAKRVTEQATT